jgi:hypothetical protein
VTVAEGVGVSVGRDVVKTFISTALASTTIEEVA